MIDRSFGSHIKITSKAVSARKCLLLVGQDFYELGAIGTKKYLYSLKEKSFADAEELCKQNGGKLLDLFSW